MNMKITPPNHPSQITPGKPVSETSPQSSGPSFGQVLNQAVNPPASSESKVPASLQINRPQIVSENPLPTPQASVSMVETTLAAFESYRKALADPNATSLRQVEPILASLESQRQIMEAALENLPADSPLRQIGNEASAAILTEQNRFYSGIYS